MVEVVRAIPQFIMIPIQYLDENDVEIDYLLKVYKHGPTCPVPVVIEVDAASADYEDNFPSQAELADGSMSDSRWVARARRANFLRYRDILRAVAPSLAGLPDDVSDILAADEANWRPILEPAGWWNATPSADEPAVGETIGIAATGE